jgi:NAD(P)-dependent dehydrogenase (short-subunit alcohol dehydrogenase family)
MSVYVSSKERDSVVAMAIVLITGTSTGIGRACAEFFRSRGDLVYGGSRKPDVRNDESVNTAVSDILEREGRIDILINNAGIAIAGAVEDTSMEEAKEQFEVNFFGTLRVCKAVLPAMRAQRSGYIINISSIAGLIAMPYQGLYSASKFAVEGLSESLRMETRDFGIKIVLIEPGDHKTTLTRNRRKSAPSEPYRERFEIAASRMEKDEQNGPEPAGVARLIGRIVENPNPRLRYTVGPAPERAMVWLKRWKPYWIIEMIMKQYYSR